MAACGLVPSLTAQAARMAALGAGAKVIRSYAYRMTEADVEELRALKPDIFLLSGGTDGGNRENIVENARLLATAPGDFPVILAGNRVAAGECAGFFQNSAHPVRVTENVMPTFNQLNIEPAKAVIRQLFLERIIQAKGLSRAQELIGGILMPTPAAALAALELLATRAGDVMAIDLGGATTDVYSIADGLPESAGTVYTGLPEPYAKRTVEGDIGMRWSARGVVEEAGLARVCALAQLTEGEVEAELARIDGNRSVLPQEAGQTRLDFALAALAMEIGLLRHAGNVQRVYTPVGAVYEQRGKDLRRVKQMILTGGALVHSPHPEEMLRAALSTDHPESLMPREPRALVDRNYLLSAMGLLASLDRGAALRILEREFL